MSVVSISVPDLISNTMFPVLAAKELRCFDEEGVQVDVQLHTGIRAVQALHDGSVEFCATGAEQPLALFPEWRGVRLLAAVARGTPFCSCCDPTWPLSAMISAHSVGAGSVQPLSQVVC